MRRVVISKFSLSLILAVIVPCFSPSALITRTLFSANKVFMASGVAVVAKSKSEGVCLSLKVDSSN